MLNQHPDPTKTLFTPNATSLLELDNHSWPRNISNMHEYHYAVLQSGADRQTKPFQTTEVQKWMIWV